jgi:hypothetical protein
LEAVRDAGEDDPTRLALLNAFLDLEPALRRALPSVQQVAEHLSLDPSYVREELDFMRVAGGQILQFGEVDWGKPPTRTKAEQVLDARARIEAGVDPKIPARMPRHELPEASSRRLLKDPSSHRRACAAGPTSTRRMNCPHGITDVRGSR